MKDLVDRATVRAIRANGDRATAEYHARLRARRFQSTRCDVCARVVWPPRMFCPRCGGDGVRWVDLPSRGTLYAFSQQARGLRFMTPDVLGLVELPGVGRVFTRIDAPIEALRIDQPVVLDFLDVGEGLVLHQFRPVAP
jgi:hypothetical protein